IKASAKQLKKELLALKEGKPAGVEERILFSVPSLGVKESWMLFSGFLMLALMLIYYPFIPFWKEHFEFFNFMMLIVFGIIVIRAFLHLLTTPPESQRLLSHSKKRKIWKIRGFIQFIISLILIWIFVVLEIKWMVFIFSSLALFYLYMIFSNSAGFSPAEGKRLALIFIGLYLIVVVPVHEALEIATWGYTKLPMDPKNEILLILGASFLIVGVSLLRERAGFFTLWFLGNGVILLIPFHEFFNFVNQEVYEPFDRGLVIIGSVLILSGYGRFAHRYLKYKETEEYIQKGIEEFNKDNYKDALKYFTKAFWRIENTGFLMDFDILWGLLGNVHFKLKEYEKALTYYTIALSINPQNPAVYNDLGNTYFYLNRYRRSLEAFKKAITLDSKNPIVYQNRGIVLNTIGRYEEAIKDLDKALELNPNLETAWREKGVALSNLELYDEAIKSFKKAFEIKKDSEAWLELGRTYFNIGDYEKALKAYENGTKYFPSEPSGFVGKALSLIELSRFREAEEALLKALELDENNSRTWNHLGNVRYAMGDYEGAITAFNRAISLDKNYSGARFSLAQVLKEMGDIERALEVYDDAVRKVSRTGREWKKVDEVEEFYESIIDKQPNNYKVWMALGNLYFRKRLLRKAIQCYDKAISFTPTNSKLWNYKGITYRRMHHYHEALECFQKAAKFNPKYADAYNNMGNIYLILGDYSKAIQMYNKSLELTPDNRRTIRNRRICINRLQRAEQIEVSSIPKAEERKVEEIDLKLDR
ncbi:MAG TPA: tetratricopeptide repeat protein, partial [Thermoplasmata archaeon]|nr:tetratricopeptide repeat protein [Thermoplasmata archaeon]